MASAAAKAVAKEVLETIGKGKRPNITKIAIQKGYSPTTAGSGLVQATKSYQEVISPLVAALMRERDAIIVELGKKRGKAKYRDLIDGLDKVSKNIALLTGKATANVAVSFKRMNDHDLERIANGGEEGTSEEGTGEA